MGVRLAGLFAAAFLMAAPQASANVMTLTYFGSVTSGQDELGLFGPDLDLAGRAFTATFTFDTAFAGRSTDAFSDRIDGGSDNGLPSFLTAAIEIGGFTHYFPGGVVESVVKTNGLIMALSSNTDDIGPPDMAKPNDDVLWLSLFGTVNLLNLDHNDAWAAATSCCYFELSPTNSGRSYGSLQVTRATLVGAAAPEPAAWALMILGFGAVGAMARRQVRLSAAA